MCIYIIYGGGGGDDDVTPDRRLQLYKSSVTGGNTAYSSARWMNMVRKQIVKRIMVGHEVGDMRHIKLSENHFPP